MQTPLAHSRRSLLVAASIALLVASCGRDVDAPRTVRGVPVAGAGDEEIEWKGTGEGEGEREGLEPDAPDAPDEPDAPDAPAEPADPAEPAEPAEPDAHTGVESPSEDCGQYPYSAAALFEELEGFGQNTEGGDPERIYTVTTLSSGNGAGSLRAALESEEPWWIVFDTDGVITLANELIDVRSHKTVDGRGRDITINGHLRLRDARHVILTDLKLTNDLEGHCTQAGDVVTIMGDAGASPSDYTSRHIWLHHVEIFNGGDGLLDVRGGTDITVSWSHFHTHKKGLLLSDPDDLPDGPSGMRITMHHNLFDRISLRGPQLVGGRMHFANNHQHRFYEYGAGALGGARFLSEGNVYEAREGAYCFVNDCDDPNPCGDSDFAVAKEGLVTEWASNGSGFTHSVGDVTWNDAELSLNGAEEIDFDPADVAPVTIEPAGEPLTARLAIGTGPRASYCQ